MGTPTVSKLLLASMMDSSAFESLEALCGKTYFESKKVACIPNASAAESLDDEMGQWRGQGYDVGMMDLRGQTVSSIEATLERSDIVYCAAGNTFHLLDQIYRSGLGPLMLPFLARGGVYVGASAGAVVATPEIEPACIVDDCTIAPDLASTRGM
jgi:dipeptidase E